MMDHRAKGSIVMVIALALIMIPFMVIIFPIAFEFMGEAAIDGWGPGPEAVWTILPRVLVLLMFGFVVTIIIRQS